MNSGGRGVQITLSAEELLAVARRNTGVDLIDAEVLEPLSILLHSLNHESNLHAAGARAMQEKIVRNLSNRLRMQRDYRRHPEIADQTIHAPIFVCGMGRTGSTKTQKMLAASGDFNWLPYWKAFNPSLLTGLRSESPQARIDDCEAFAQWFDAASPETRAGHPFRTHEAEEESFILEHSLKSPVLMGWAPMPTYLQWLMSRDMSAQFILLRDMLKYLQWQGLADSNRRWILKSPLYSGLEPLLLGAFPDACLLMTHRTPVETIPSGLRLMECFYKPFTNSPPDPAFYVAGQAGAIRQHLANRASMKPDGFLDILFRDLTRDASGVLDRIYAHCGMTLDPASRRRMLDWNDDNPQHRFGKHAYALQDYGLTQAGIEAAFPEYIEFVSRLNPSIV
jgi:hypothetical protein